MPDLAAPEETVARLRSRLTAPAAPTNSSPGNDHFIQSGRVARRAPALPGGMGSRLAFPRRTGDAHGIAPEPLVQGIYRGHQVSSSIRLYRFRFIEQVQARLFLLFLPFLLSALQFHQHHPCLRVAVSWLVDRAERRDCGIHQY